MEIKAQLGYLTALLEELKDEVKANRTEVQEWQEKTNTSLSKLQKELDMYTTVIKTLKLIVAAVAALITFKWSGLHDIWQHFWK